MNAEKAAELIASLWDESIVPTLVDYVKIPAKSPAFDADWEEHGHLRRAVELAADWCRQQPIEGMRVEICELPGRTPVLLIEVPARPASSSEEPQGETVLLYGHLDKQPEMTGWHEGLGPWIPVLRDDKLYGRGGADDGYAVFASLAALRALQEQDQPHARCVVLIEASEESGSPDLPAHVEALSERIGNPSLVVCLDSGCGNYEQLWCTTSLRGMAAGTLRVDILEEGVHSGDASGVVPSSFRILRQLLSRLEDESTGRLRPEAFHVEVPAARKAQAARAAEVLGPPLWQRFPFVPGAVPSGRDLGELVLARTWRPSLSVTGAEGLPALADAGNVLRPGTAVKLSLRFPPTVDAVAATAAVKELLEKDPPSGARVSFVADTAAHGWNAPALAPWLEAAAEKASQEFFGKEAVYLGEGGSIPFMAMLGERFPEAQFFVTGLLGPGSNAHGPNEFLHLPTGKRLTGCVARLLVEQALATRA